MSLWPLGDLLFKVSDDPLACLFRGDELFEVCSRVRVLETSLGLGSYSQCNGPVSYSETWLISIPATNVENNF